MRIDIEMEEWDNALDAIHGPGAESVVEFDAIMSAAFAETQAVVHVDTGSLKASGRVTFSDGSDSWSGEISYGGPSAGSVNDPVEYADTEMARGGSHDFLRNVDLMTADIANAMFASMKNRMKT